MFNAISILAFYYQIQFLLLPFYFLLEFL